MASPQYLALKNFSKLPSMAQRVIAGKSIRYHGHGLNQSLQLILSRLNGEQLEGMLVNEARKTYADALKNLLPTRYAMHKVMDFRIPVTNNQDVVIRQYIPLCHRPETRTPKEEKGNKPSTPALPAIFYLHGGGMVLGDVDCYDHWLRYLAQQTQCCIYALDYRKAPEFTFPVQAEDTLSGWQWLCDMAEHHHIDLQRTLVMGDSAGGSLAAYLCQKVRTLNIPSPIAQCLMYPNLDHKNNYPAYQQLDRLGISMGNSRWMQKNFLLDLSLADNVVASPLLADDRVFEQLPPAIISVAGFDPLHEHGEAYTLKLEKNGTESVLLKHPTLVHAYLMFHETVTDAHSAVNEIFTAIRKVVHT